MTNDAARSATRRLDLSVGSLDEPAALTPISHFAVESRIANWHADDGLPGERIDEHVKLTERWKKAYGDDVVPGIVAVRTQPDDASASALIASRQSSISACSWATRASPRRC
jgi:hypothetical protein